MLGAQWAQSGCSATCTSGSYVVPVRHILGLVQHGDWGVLFLRSSGHPGAGGGVANRLPILFLFVYHSNKVPQVAIMLNHYDDNVSGHSGNS